MKYALIKDVVALDYHHAKSLGNFVASRVGCHRTLSSNDSGAFPKNLYRIDVVIQCIDQRITMAQRERNNLLKHLPRWEEYKAELEKLKEIKSKVHE